MRDLNFFQPYIEKNEITSSKKLIYHVLISFILFGLIAYSIYNEIIIKYETSVVEKLRNTVEDPKLIKKIEDIKAKELEVMEYKDLVGKIRLLDKSIEERDIIDEELLSQITSKMPEDLFFTSVSIYDDIQIVGVSKDKWSVAQLEKGLEEISVVEEVFISNISLNETDYNFSINITLKGVNQSGEDLEDEPN